MKKNTSEKKAKKSESVNWIDDKFAVTNVNNYSDDVTFFVLHVKTALGNMTISDCRVVTRKDGEGYFISLPTKKNGEKYYSVVYCPISDEDSELIINTISDMIE